MLTAMHLTITVYPKMHNNRIIILFFIIETDKYNVHVRGKLVKPPFHWTAIPLRFEILVKMTWIAAETTRT